MSVKLKEKGSLWRIWDLHIHTPCSVLNNSFGDKWDEYVSQLFKKAIKNNIAVVGITDYFTIEGYKKIKNEYLDNDEKLSKLFTTNEIESIKSILILPNIEFRLNKLVGKNRINFHVLLSNEIPIQDIEENFLHDLDFTKVAETQTADETYKLKSINLEQLGNRLQEQHPYFDDKPPIYVGMMNAAVDDKQIGEILANRKSIFEGKYLIALPSDEDLSDVSWNSQDHLARKLLIQKSDIFLATNPKTIQWALGKKHETPEKFIEEFKSIKPCIGGSDAHNYDELFEKNGDKKTWIKSDTTFEGLKQILIEPDRVYIGEEPDLLKRVRTNQTKFIKSLKISKVQGVDIDDMWFDDLQIEFNSGFVAIIGNKGGGKSAIADIIGLCANTHQDPSKFSFLTKSKFRKPKPFNLSEKFEAALTWVDGSTSTTRLNKDPERSLPERIKYIPQNFFENLCANIESEDFEKELQKVIFTHTPNDKRLGKSSLEELMDYKSELVNEEILLIKSSIQKLNREIQILEEKTTVNYKESVKSQLQLKKDELAAHETIKPQMPEVIGENSTEGVTDSDMADIRQQIAKIEVEIENLRNKKHILEFDKEELNKTISYYKNLDKELKKRCDSNDDYVKVLSKHGIDVKDIFSYKIDTTKIVDFVGKTDQNLTTLENLLNVNFGDSITKQLQELNKRLQEKQETLDKPAREYQKFLNATDEWKKRKIEIEGSGNIEGSLKFYEAQLEYLEEALTSEINLKYSERNNLASQLFEKKLSLIEIRQELFQPVMEFVNDYKELKKRYDVKIDVALELRSFHDDFFSYVNQSKSGTFNGKEEGYKKLAEMIERNHFSTVEGFLQFINEVSGSLQFDKRNYSENPMEIKSQLKRGKEVSEFYDFIYNAEYLEPVYSLRLGSKTLEELSPGERGALLLIFYLILDKDDIPLVIDQPEENLDNESVYHILVHFIKKVKEQRQIIIVTHNPNLAVVCDADQVINISIEKENKNTVKYISGSIENPDVNKAIVNILEGTLPAFNNRDAKYIR